MTVRWVLVESEQLPKNSAGSGEDRLLVLEDASGVTCCAVVDGATDKSGRSYGGVTGGTLAAECVVDVLRRLPPDADPDTGLSAVTQHLSALRTTWQVADDDVQAPSAVAAVFLPRRRQLWRVGDIHMAVACDSRWHAYPAEKGIDHVVAAARAALVTCHLVQGGTVDDLAVADPGREMMLPLLQRQNALANTDIPLGFGVLDGRTVPSRFLEVIDLADDVTEIVLATDGYLAPAPTLREAEEELAASLTADPLRIGKHAATKAVTPGADSFDDRTYVRLRRAPTTT